MEEQLHLLSTLLCLSTLRVQHSESCESTTSRLSVSSGFEAEFTVTVTESTREITADLNSDTLLLATVTLHNGMCVQCYHNVKLEVIDHLQDLILWKCQDTSKSSDCSAMAHRAILALLQSLDLKTVRSAL